MRISKEKSERITAVLLEPIKNKLQNKEDKLKKEVTEYLLSSLPEEILNIFIKYPDYLILSNSIFILRLEDRNLLFNNKGNYYLKLSQYIPINPIYKNDKDFFKNIFNKFKNKFIEIYILKDRITELEFELKETILQSNTFKNLQIILPDVYNVAISLYEKKSSPLFPATLNNYLQDKLKSIEKDLVWKMN